MKLSLRYFLIEGIILSKSTEHTGCTKTIRSIISLASAKEYHSQRFLIILLLSLCTALTNVLARTQTCGWQNFLNILPENLTIFEKQFAWQEGTRSAVLSCI